MKEKMRLRLSRVISSFQSCRQKASASALPPVFFLSPANPKKFDIEFPAAPPPPRSSPSRPYAAVVVSTAGCRSCAPVASSSPVRLNLSPAVDWGADELSRARETPAYLWRKEEKWHVVTCAEEFERRRKIDCEDEEEDQEEDGDDLFPSSFSKIAARRRKREIEIRRRRGRQSRSKSRNSTSSVASGSWFSSDDYENDEREDEDDDDDDDDDDGNDTDTLLSSRSISTDSTGVFRSRRRCTSPEPSWASTGAAAALSRLVPCVGEQGVKVRESIAVVKKSEDPRADFRQSMAEMVVEKGMYDGAELEQLLHCFLSLNSRQHHRAIMAAFGDVWDALFPESSPHVSYR